MAPTSQPLALATFLPEGSVAVPRVALGPALAPPWPLGGARACEGQDSRSELCLAFPQGWSVSPQTVPSGRQGQGLLLGALDERCSGRCQVSPEILKFYYRLAGP